MGHENDSGRWGKGYSEEDYVLAHSVGRWMVVLLAEMGSNGAEQLHLHPKVAPQVSLRTWLGRHGGQGAGLERGEVISPLWK